jgi:hypothetical protein
LPISCILRPTEVRDNLVVAIQPSRGRDFTAGGMTPTPAGRKAKTY